MRLISRLRLASVPIAPLFVLDAAALEAAYMGVNMIGTLVVILAFGIWHQEDCETNHNNNDTSSRDTNRYLLRCGWGRPPMQSRP
jgi:hypothetical protein